MANRVHPHFLSSPLIIQMFVHIRQLWFLFLPLTLLPRSLSFYASVRVIIVHLYFFFPARQPCHMHAVTYNVTVMPLARHQILSFTILHSPHRYQPFAPFSYHHHGHVHRLVLIMCSCNDVTLDVTLSCDTCTCTLLTMNARLDDDDETSAVPRRMIVLEPRDNPSYW